MSRQIIRNTFAVVVLVGGLAALAPRMAGQQPPGQQVSGQPSIKNGEWPQYAADEKGQRYSPLSQIDASNFNKMEVAWRFKTDALGPRPEYKLEGTPIMVKGVLYTTGGTRRSVIALDAKTGELIWSHSMREGLRAAISPRQLSGRGVSYWTDGKGDDRVIYVTTGYRLVELNAKTGAPIPGFGTDGMVDLKVGAIIGADTQIELEKGEIGLHATPTVVKDVILVGSSFAEGMTPMSHNNTKGLARAYDVRTGKKLWQFNTIPKPGEFGNETWEKDSWAVNGNTGIWTGITADADLGLVYLGVEEPTMDTYGGHRPGNDLFADSLVCVDLRTGVRKWHYQVVHHPIWDFDMSSPAMLVDINVDGKPIKAVAVPSKQAFLYVFDRVTGKPVWPFVERPVPQSDVPGEKTSPTQPFPTKPPPYARQFLKVPDDVIDFTPELREKALEKLKHHLHPETPFPAIPLGNLTTIAGVIYGNATNWPGGGLDPETHIAYIPAANNLIERSLATPPAGFSDIKYLSGVEGQPFHVALGPGYGTAPDAPTEGDQQAKLRALLKAEPPRPGTGGLENNVNGLVIDGLPIMKPPYGIISAVDLDKGELKWQVAHGDTPDAVRNHPALKGLTIPKTGQAGSVGLLVTKTLVVVGDPQLTTTPDHPRGAMFRAYDKQTGKEVGAVWMPAQQSGSPMTYAVDGKQYIVVAIGGGSYSGEYVAFSLPTAESRRTTQGGGH